MRALQSTVSNIAPTDIPILLVGESGTGKDVVALEIHRLSGRGHERFLKVSCAAVTAESLGGWMVGSENGNSQGGTVFLDEIGELDLACQPKLVHALPDGNHVPQGFCLRARVISATRHNLEEEMRQGRFREELFYRINGVCLRLPPLRERKEDIAGLVDFFLTKYAALFGRPKPALAPESVRRLTDYCWPGNVRELENAVRKIVALGDERAVAAGWGGSVRDAAPAKTAAEAGSLKQVARAASRQAERELILEVLGRTHWNRKRAAQELQISYKALLYKLKQMGLDDEGSGPPAPG